MITELTEEMEARIPVIRDKWIELGLSTEPANREEAEKGVNLAYELSGLEPPREIVWCESPFQATKTAMDRGATRAGATAFIYGGQGYWLSFYDYFQEYVDGLEILEGLMKVAENAGWWLAFEYVAFVCERPYILERDEEGQLHNETDAAVKWNDGEGVYVWHGTRVPKHVIMEPENITVDMIDNERNAEVRRVMMERYGIERYAETGELVHEDEFGKLIRKEVPDDEDVLVVLVENSTPEPDGTRKTYGIRVPPNEGLKTAHAAVAWTFGLDPEDYKPLKET